MEAIEPTELLMHLLDNHESEFIEFKKNNYSSVLIAETLCALANGAVLEDKTEAYLVYGVDSKTREIVGTDFDPSKERHGNIPLKRWLSDVLKNSAPIEYRIVDNPKGRVVIMRIPRAQMTPVRYDGETWVRIGESKTRVSKNPSIERKLWQVLMQVTFEDGQATGLIDEEAVFRLLDFDQYYDRQDKAVPGREAMLATMKYEGVIISELGKYFITNMGALLFARDLAAIEFDKTLVGRAPRIIRYNGIDKTNVEVSYDGKRGYVVGVDNMLAMVMKHLPTEEYLAANGSRKQRELITIDAIRELAVNMFIHQDFAITGYAPRIEIYNDRVEFSNSGEPIINKERFIDLNRSRNPKFAGLVHTMKLCEERGMGIDIVERACEQLYLPSITVIAGDDFTRVTVHGRKTLRQYTVSDRLNLVYMHAGLQHIKHDVLTNRSLRERFPEDIMSLVVASRWIADALEAGKIKQVETGSQSRKFARYVPFWA